MRRSNAGPIIILGTIFLVFLVILAAMPRSPLPIGGGGWGILGHRLTTEVTPPETLYSTTLNLEPGSVYQVTYNANGITITQRSSQLIERLNLTGDIGTGDIVAPHLYDWYYTINRQDSYRFIVYGITGEIPTDVLFGLTVPEDLTGGGWILRIMLTDNSIEKYWVGMGAWNNNLEINAFNSTGRYITAGLHWVPGNINVTAHIEQGNYYLSCCGNSISTENIITNASNTYNRVVLSFDYLAINTPIPIRLYYVKIGDKILDPTFTNGTVYYTADGIHGTPNGNVLRIPAANTWLWLVKSAAGDSRLHVRYVPPGSILRIKYNGMIYEWHITGTPNSAGLIEDYPIDIAGVFGQTTLPNATVELIYPSQKVRFYVPQGFQIQVVSSNWTETHEVPLNSSYVDFGLPKGGTYTIRVLGYEQQPRVTVQTTSSNVKVTVTDPNGYALSGAKVYIYNSNNELAAEGITNDFGVFQFNKTALSSDQARIIVSHLANGYYYHMDKLVTLNGLVTIQPRYPRPINLPEAAATGGNSSGAAVGIVIILLLAVLTVALLAGRRR